jgi:hypothetical protein
VKEDTMRKILWALAAAGTCLLVAAALLGDEPPTKAEKARMKAGEEAALAWLALVDSGDYARSWRESAGLFKKEVTQGEWEQSAKAARETFGKLLSRSLKAGEYGRATPGDTRGEYLILVYDSSFEKRKTAAETVVPVKEKDGVWRVAGYATK